MLWVSHIELLELNEIINNKSNEITKWVGEGKKKKTNDP